MSHFATNAVAVGASLSLATSTVTDTDRSTTQKELAPSSITETVSSPKNLNTPRNSESVPSAQDRISHSQTIEALNTANDAYANDLYDLTLAAYDPILNKLEMQHGDYLLYLSAAGKSGIITPDETLTSVLSNLRSRFPDKTDETSEMLYTIAHNSQNSNPQLASKLNLELDQNYGASLHTQLIRYEHAFNLAATEQIEAAITLFEQIPIQHDKVGVLARISIANLGSAYGFYAQAAHALKELQTFQGNLTPEQNLQLASCLTELHSKPETAAQAFLSLDQTLQLYSQYINDQQFTDNLLHYERFGRASALRALQIHEDLQEVTPNQAQLRTYQQLANQAENYLREATNAEDPKFRVMMRCSYAKFLPYLSNNPLETTTTTTTQLRWFKSLRQLELATSELAEVPIDSRQALSTELVNLATKLSKSCPDRLRDRFASLANN